jgi:hypothetical protein
MLEQTDAVLGKLREGLHLRLDGTLYEALPKRWVELVHKQSKVERAEAERQRKVTRSQASD